MAVPVGHALGVLEFSLAGDSEPMNITLGIDPTAYSGDFNAAVAHFGLSFWSVFQASFGDGYTLERALFYVGQDGTTATAVYEEVIGTDGGAGTDRLPQNCALLVRKSSGVPGRRNKGRFYVPGILGESVVGDTGVISGAVVTSLQTKFDDWMDELTIPGAGYTAALTPEIFHSTGDQTPTPVTELQVESLIATQRQRLRR